MKKIVFTLLTGLLISLATFAQNFTVTVYGTVMIVSENSISPVPGQAVIISIDSSSYGFTYQNTVYTNNDGYYEDVYVRTPSGWRFKSRTHHALLNQGKRVTPEPAKR